jgi:hypothetical protein
VTASRSGFDPGPIIVKFVVQTILEKQVFLRVFQYFLDSIILLMVHTPFLLNTIPLLTEGKAGEDCEP